MLVDGIVFADARLADGVPFLEARWLATADDVACTEEGGWAAGAAANFAFWNRQPLMHHARRVFAAVCGTAWERLGMTLFFDAAHNVAKMERHTVGLAHRGRRRISCTDAACGPRSPSSSVNVTAAPTAAPRRPSPPRACSWK